MHHPKLRYFVARSLVLAPAAALAAADLYLDAPALASPLMNFTFLGRVQGSSDPYTPTLAVNAGDLIEYQIVANMSPVGTVYTGPSQRTITSLNVGSDGANSMSFDIFQLAADPIQSNFSSLATLNPDPTAQPNDSWAGSIAADAGHISARPSSSNFDLTRIIAAHAPGVWTAIQPEIVSTGSFAVASAAAGGTSQVRIRHTSSISGLHINGTGLAFFPTTGSETSANPFFNYGTLTLTLGVSGNSTWNVDASGNWSDSGNWLNGVPNGAGANADFKGVINSPRTVTVDGPKTVGSIVLMNSNKYTIAGPGPLTMNAGVGPAATINLSQGSHEISAPMVLASATTSLTVASASESLTLSGPVSGSGGFSAGSVGTLILSGSNSYTGPTAVNGGTLRIATSANLGDDTSASNSLTLNGATVRFDGPLSTARSLILDTNDGILDVQSNNVTWSGGISGPPSARLVKTGDGTLLLNGPSTYLGETVVSAGTIKAGAADVFAAGSLHTVPAGTTVDLNGLNQTVSGLRGSGSVSLGAGTLTIVGTSVSDGFAGTISGSGGLTVYHGPTVPNVRQHLSSPNSYSGPTTVIGNGMPNSQLRILSSSNLGDSSATNTIVLSNLGAIIIDGSFVEPRNITVGPGDGAINVVVGNTVTLTGTISGTGGFRANSDNNSGILVLAGQSTYSGPTIANFGTLRLAAANVMSSNSNLIVEPNGIVDLAGFGQSVGTVAGSGAIHLGSGRLTSNAQSSTTYSGPIDGSGGLTKEGPGILTLAGLSTYTGATIVGDGTLQLGAANRIANSSNMVLDGGTFDANGFSEQVGTFQLLDDSLIDLGPISMLKFAASGSVSWTPTAELLVDDWSGNLNGGGAEGLFVGTSASLTVSQLSQILFRNPAGFGPGLYAAKQLSSGEVVPLPEPSLVGLLAVAGSAMLTRRRRSTRYA